MNPLQIPLDDIHESAQPLEADLPREELDAMLLGDHPTEFHAAGPARVRARLTKMGRKVLVQAKFAVPLTGQCKRCLTDVPVEAAVDATLTYVPAPEPQPAKGDERGRKDEPRRRQGGGHDADEEGTAASFDPETADEEHYTGTELDLRPALREQVLLSLPPSPLCREECLGLCPACGEDKNRTDCGHSARPPDPRWEALKSIQLVPKKES